MIPAGVTLYTWVDVEEVLLRAREQAEQSWPSSLVEARCYWDELLLRVRDVESAGPEVLEWIHLQFEPRYQDSPARIVLEAKPGGQRVLPVRLEEAAQDEKPCRVRPTFSRPRRLCSPSTDRLPPPPLAAGSPPIVAFHSFKGGVGRTTHALAFALRAAERSGRPILLIDGDFEAPGITWHVRNDPRVAVAYADFLALLHSDPLPSAEDAIALTANKLASQRFGSLFVMPAFREPGRWSTLEVPPNLLQDRIPDNPFGLTESLASLGKAIGVASVVVDLRAGLSELSAGLLLDPRISRVVVTTMSSQSLAGTKELLRQLGRVSAVSGTESGAMPTSSLVVNSVPKELVGSDKLRDETTELFQAGTEYFAISAADEPVEPSLITSEFAPGLLTLPAAWDEVIETIRKTGVSETITKIVEEMVVADAAPKASGDPSQVAKRRRDLADFATKLEYAEGGEVSQFLSIRALSNLARDFRRSLPLAAIIGAKGSGKTYTFLQMVRVGFWGSFVDEVIGAEQPERQTELFPPIVDAKGACIVPALVPRNLQNVAENWVAKAEQRCEETLGFGKPISALEIREAARSRLTLAPPEGGSWLTWWLDVIAQRCGLPSNPTQAGASLVAKLTASNRTVLAVVDGLEDLFQTIHGSDAQKEALRALLQDVPEWLRQAAGGCVGLLVFLRSDLVRAAIPQNTGQFIAKYEPYRLRWNDYEALRLAAWTASRAGATDPTIPEDMDELIAYLTQLWGVKMGAPDSKEAYSNRWTLAALSDYQGQLQARDMVRLIAEAAKRSRDATADAQSDRLLVASALRAALKTCGEKKVTELEQEAPSLKSIFKKIRDLPAEIRQVPFREGNLNLTDSEIELLTEQGLLARDDRDYYVPELIRLGLGMDLSRRGRPRMLALRRYGVGTE